MRTSTFIMSFRRSGAVEQDIEPARCDSIINKSPLTARTNRSIGGDAPGEYLERIASSDVPRNVLDGYLRSHLIDSEHMWSNDFHKYFSARQSALLDRIRAVMGKQIASDDIEEPDEAPRGVRTGAERQFGLQLWRHSLNALMAWDGFES